MAKNIVESWLLAINGSLHENVDRLSKTVGKTITVSKFGEYRSGVVALPRNIHEAMLIDALLFILIASGIKCPGDVDEKELVAALMPPEPKRKVYGKKPK